MTAGRCLCGNVRYETREAPLWVAHCHCESCRRQTGAALATFVGFDKSRVTFTRGERASYASSPGVTRGFCADCGTPLSYEAVSYANEIHLYLSTFDFPGEFHPTRHVFYDERVPGFEVHDDLPRFGHGEKTPMAWGPVPTRKVLFLCTGNSARSILAEAIADRLGAQRAASGGPRIRSFSAGSKPRENVHPEALALLAREGYVVAGLSSKSWNDVVEIPFDWIVTLCDAAADESCPAFAGDGQRLHWSLPDPASGAASFEATYQGLIPRIKGLLAD